jgi:DNA-binding CsgD family transcriptional regulator
MTRMTVEMASIGITPREKQVLDLIIDGNANRAIATSMGISLDTVKSHLSHLFKKAGCDSRLQLAMKFHQFQGAQDEKAFLFSDSIPGLARILSDVAQGCRE